jgi:hypothetical protein
MKRTKQNKFPPGWDAARVRRVVAGYESQTEAEAVAEDEAAFEGTEPTMMAVPQELVPAVRELIAESAARSGSRRKPRRRPTAARAAK